MDGDPVLSEMVACLDVMTYLSAMLVDTVSHFLCGRDHEVLQGNGGKGAEGLVGGAAERRTEGAGGGAGGVDTLKNLDEHQVKDVLCQGLHLLKIIR